MANAWSEVLRGLTPKSLSGLREPYGWGGLRKDLQAGLTVGVVALPLAMAFAIASGVGPEKGLFTGIVAGLAISLLSGSRFQIGGPTGAFVVIVAGVIAKHGLDGLALATLMAGGMLVVFAFTGLGGLIRYIPYPVTTGFTTGIAVVIFSSQVKDLFGLSMTEVPAEFIEKWGAYISHASGLNITAAAVGLGSLGLLVAVRRFAPRIPGPLLVIVLASVVVWVAKLPVETIDSRFGSIPNMLPSPSLPAISMERMQALLPSALTIAALAAIESLLSAVVADGMTGDQHRPNAEILGQGVANIASVVFGGIPATGAIARTATNIRAGAHGPWAGIIHAATLLGIMLLAAPLAGMIPLASLAAVLVLVSWNMAELDKFRFIFRAPRSDAAVLLTTFLLTVLVDLNVAIQAGLLLAALLFMRRMIQVAGVGPLPWLDHEAGAAHSMARRMTMPEVEVYEITGPFFFGVADRLKAVLDILTRPPRVFVLRMRNVPAIDATGLHALRLFYQRCHRQHTTLVLSGVQAQPERALLRSGLAELIGPDNICHDINTALDRAQHIVAASHAHSPHVEHAAEAH